MNIRAILEAGERRGVHPRLKPRISKAEARRTALFVRIDRIKFRRGLEALIKYQIEPHFPR